jgi:hypothetical protein
MGVIAWTAFEQSISVSMARAREKAMLFGFGLLLNDSFLNSCVTEKTFML